MAKPDVVMVQVETLPNRACAVVVIEVMRPLVLFVVIVRIVLIVTKVDAGVVMGVGMMEVVVRCIESSVIVIREFVESGPTGENVGLEPSGTDMRIHTTMPTAQQVVEITG